MALTTQPEQVDSVVNCSSIIENNNATIVENINHDPIISIAINAPNTMTNETKPATRNIDKKQT